MAKGLKPTPQLALDRLLPNLDRLLQDIGHLASICDATTSGSTRRVFSSEYVAGREFVARRMCDAGLDTSYDGVGNLIGTRPGESGALVTGSHTDTVDGGGKLDGVLGVLGAIEAIRSLDEAGIQLNHELRVLDFLGEEPNDWGISCIGSRGLAGELGAYELGCLSPDGTTLEAALAAFDIKAGPATSAAWSQGEIRAFVELHIEQGPVLEQANIPIGVVTGIAGVQRFLIDFHGRRDHAGTMPMALRHDAAAAAAQTIVAVESATSDGHGVGTCGIVEVMPGALNVVPDLARVGVELRSIDGDWISDRRAEVEERARHAGEKRGVTVAFTELSHEAPTPMHAIGQAAVSEAANALGYKTMPLASGAEHDTRRMARLGPAAMIFVPSINGRSHCPEEDTAPAHLKAGVATLAATLALLDKQVDLNGLQ